MKSKNVSIKKMMEANLLTQDKNHKLKQSGKSLKMPNHSSTSTKPSPISQMIHNPYPQSISESLNPNDFMSCLNNYLGKLDVSSTGSSEIQTIREKLEKEKTINRNLQKNVIDFQKVLWDRAQKLQSIEAMLKKIQNSENQRDMANQISLRKKIAKEISSKNTRFCSESSSEDEKYYVENRVMGESRGEGYRRRKTEIPCELEKIISRTIELNQSKRQTSRFI